MNYSDWSVLEKKVKKEMNVQRFHHTQGVMYTAAAMAMAFGEDVERAKMAGLLHDCAKSCVPNSKKAKLCDTYGIKYSDFEKRNPQLLHGKLGAYFAKHIYGVKDAEICSAIACHTTGKPKMTVLEKIIFIADYIEPDRSGMPRLDEIRKMAFCDLDMCVEMIMSDTLKYLKEAGRPIDDATAKAYDYYHKLIKAREND